MRRWLPVAASVLLLGGCTAAEAKTPAVACAVVSHGKLMDESIKESSGVVESIHHPGLFWTVKSAGHSHKLFAIGGDGRLFATIHVSDAKNHDWEDLTAGPGGEPCATDDQDSADEAGSGRSRTGRCLYIADTGYKTHRKGERLSIFVVPEPSLTDSITLDAAEHRADFPKGRRDVQALVVLTDGQIFVITSGVDGPIELWRWPTPLRSKRKSAGEDTLRFVRTLEPQPQHEEDFVTGASASPDGKWVALRTYDALAFYRTPDLLGNGRPAAQLDLSSLAEPQGEGVSISADGLVALTSEGPGHKHLPSTISLLRCAFPR